MTKVVSYRQKLLELARIYRINKVFDQNIKYTTYDIEIILLKNRVPIPSRNRGYFSHKIINEIFNPLIEKSKKYFYIKLNPYQYAKKFFSEIFRPIYENFRKILSININPRKYLKKYLQKFFHGIENYFKFVIFNILNFFKTLSNTTIDTLNDLYNFKIKEKIIKNIFTKVAYVSLVGVLVYSGFYIKDLVTDVDSLKISLEIKSDKRKNPEKLKEEKKIILKI